MYDEAAAEYRQVIKRKPNDVQANHHLGIALLEKEMYKEAVACFKKVLRINPNYALSHGALGFAKERSSYKGV